MVTTRARYYATPKRDQRRKKQRELGKFWTPKYTPQVKKYFSPGSIAKASVPQVTVDRTNNNIATVYKGKALVGRKKKRYFAKTRFNNRVKMAALSTKGLKTMMFKNWSVGSIAPRIVSGLLNSQVIWECAFYCNGIHANDSVSEREGFMDIRRLMQTDFLAPDTFRLQRSKIMITGMHAEIEMTNVGTNTVYVDVYTVTNRKEQNIGSQVTPRTYLDTCLAQTSVPQGPAGTAGPDTLTSASLSALGVTPFVSSLWCEKYKVLNKRTLVFEPGQIMRWEVSRAKPYWVDGAKIGVGQADGNTEFSVYELKPTWYYMFFARGAADAENIATRCDLTWKFTREYYYKRETTGLNQEMDDGLGVYNFVA